MQYYPLPTEPGLTNNFNQALPLNLVQNQTLDRVDHNVGQNVRLFGRFIWQKLTFESGSPVPTSSSYSPTMDRNGVIGYTHIITPNFINDFRFGFNVLTSDANNGFAQSGMKDAGSQLGIPGFTADVDNNNPGIPTFVIPGYAGLGSAGTNWKQDDRTLHGYDQISWTKGKHNIMAGADIRRMTIGRAAQNDPRGNFTFNGEYTSQCVYRRISPIRAPTDYCHTAMPSLTLLLVELQIVATPTFQVKGSVGSWRNGYFVQDNWQVPQKLTLLYGVRYEQPTIPYSLNGYARILNADFTALIPASQCDKWCNIHRQLLDSSSPALITICGLRVSDLPIAPPIRSSFVEAEVSTTTQTTSMPSLLLAETIRSLARPPIPRIPFSPRTPFPIRAVERCTVPLASQVRSRYATTSSLQMQPACRLPECISGMLDTGVELWKDAAFELQYLGSESVHLDFSWQPNQPVPGPWSNVNARRPNQRFGAIREIYNGGFSTYNGLTAIFRQRVNRGLSMNLSYTWAHNMDTSNDANGSGYLMNPYNIKGDYGNSNWDIRHRFVGTVLYQLPDFADRGYAFRAVAGGWQANAIVFLQTGMPFNVGLASDVANTATSGIQRPNLRARLDQTPAPRVCCP